MQHKISNLKFIKGVPIEGGERTTYTLVGGPRTKADKIGQIEIEDADAVEIIIPVPEGRASVQPPAATVLKNLLMQVDGIKEAIQEALDSILSANPAITSPFTSDGVGSMAEAIKVTTGIDVGTGDGLREGEGHNEPAELPEEKAA